MEFAKGFSSSEIPLSIGGFRLSSRIRIHFENASKHWIKKIDLVQVVIEKFSGGELVLGEGVLDFGDGCFVDRKLRTVGSDEE